MHQRYHLALHAPLTLSRIHSEGSERKALKSALQRVLLLAAALRQLLSSHSNAMLVKVSSEQLAVAVSDCPAR